MPGSAPLVDAEDARGAKKQPADDGDGDQDAKRAQAGLARAVAEVVGRRVDERRPVAAAAACSSHRKRGTREYATRIGWDRFPGVLDRGERRDYRARSLSVVDVHRVAVDDCEDGRVALSVDTIFDNGTKAAIGVVMASLYDDCEKNFAAWRRVSST